MSRSARRKAHGEEKEEEDEVSKAELVKKAPKPNRGGGSIILVVRLILTNGRSGRFFWGCALFTLDFVSEWWFTLYWTLLLLSVCFWGLDPLRVSSPGSIHSP